VTAQPQGNIRPVLIREVRETCSRERLFPPGSRALVMVSGGQDSITLLELSAAGLLRTEGPSEVLALHVNHHLRGQDSHDDEDLVVRHCARLGVELAVAHKPIDKSHGNVQETARWARREAALAIAEERQCCRIALGHTADDQVETMLYRIARYGGLAALRGMLPSDPPWVRPLLGLRRAQTEAFCRERGLEYAVDRGNAYPGYARTGLREQVLPFWEAVLPGAVEAAGRTAEVAAEVEKLVTLALDGTGLDLTSTDLDANRLRTLSAPLRRLALRAWLEHREGLESSRKNVLDLEGLLEMSGSVGVDLGAKWRAVREYDLLSLKRAAGPVPAVAEEVALPLPGVAEWGGVRIRAERVERFCAPDADREAYVDGAAIAGPLCVRGVRPGDRMRPLGLAGTRKLQDVLVDLRVPAARRPFVPVVVCGGSILWVCGLLSAEQGKIAAETSELVKFSVE
jgi:tRNA(Ile)-lysidine synthase